MAIRPYNAITRRANERPTRPRRAIARSGHQTWTPPRTETRSFETQLRAGTNGLSAFECASQSPIKGRPRRHRPLVVEVVHRRTVELLFGSG